MQDEFYCNIQEIVKIIKNNFNVKKIILFGSFAYGTPNKSSDIDLCIIMDLTNRSKLEIIRDIRKQIYEILVLPIDLVIYTEKEFSERALNKVTLEYKIEKEGKVLYTV